MLHSFACIKTQAIDHKEALKATTKPSTQSQQQGERIASAFSETKQQTAAAFESRFFHEQFTHLI